MELAFPVFMEPDDDFHGLGPQRIAEVEGQSFQLCQLLQTSDGVTLSIKLPQHASCQARNLREQTSLHRDNVGDLVADPLRLRDRILLTQIPNRYEI